MGSAPKTGTYPCPIIDGAIAVCQLRQLLDEPVDRLATRAVLFLIRAPLCRRLILELKLKLLQLFVAL